MGELNRDDSSDGKNYSLVETEEAGVTGQFLEWIIPNVRQGEQNRAFDV